MTILLVEGLLGFGIGLTLGMLGGGGSILTVPALVYLIGQEPRAAVTASLAIVGANSVSGVLMHRAHGTLNWRVALLFGGAGMITAFFAAKVSRVFSPTVLMIAFAMLMLVIGALMLLRRNTQQTNTEPRGIGVTLLAGAGVGALTGFFGVGGGFLIVPALVMLVGLPMRDAVGTSLLVIAMNSLSGLLGHIGSGALDVTLVVIFAAAGLLGTFVGARLAQSIHPERLRQLFAGLVILLAAYLLFDNVSKLLLA